MDRAQRRCLHFRKDVFSVLHLSARSQKHCVIITNNVSLFTSSEGLFLPGESLFDHMDQTVFLGKTEERPFLTETLKSSGPSLKKGVTH